LVKLAHLTATFDLKGEKITAVCARADKCDEVNTVLLAVTKTTVTGSVHNLRTFRIQHHEMVINATVGTTDDENATVVAAHPSPIMSMCAIPLGAVNAAAFVTCSKGTRTTVSTDGGHGLIRLWTSQTDAVPMMLKGDQVVELKCNASVTKVVATLNCEREVLIAACSSDDCFIELWNVTTGIYGRWNPGKLV
jgi:WD40 repeat protein